MKCLTFEIFTHKTPNPRWGRVGLIFVYYFSRQFMTFPGLLIFWPPKIPTATPFGGGGGFFIDFLDSSLNLPDFWNVDPQLPPPGTPRGGMGKKIFFIDFLDSSWHFPEFLFFDPLKFPLRPLPPWVGRSIFLGRNHPQICRDLCKSERCGAWRFWHVGASTGYCLGRNVRHCGKVSKCEFSSFWAVHLYHGAWLGLTYRRYHILVLPHLYKHDDCY